MSYTANKILDRLYQGGYPPPGDGLKLAGIDVLVLCAREIQTASDYPGLIVVLAPGDDDRRASVLKTVLASWKDASDQVVDHVKAGRNVLVTCQAGLNRSGLVTGLAVRKLTGWSGSTIVKHIQKSRPGALFNETFAQYLIDSFPSKK